jgi:hypothetical protein
MAGYSALSMDLLSVDKMAPLLDRQLAGRTDPSMAEKMVGLTAA